MFIDLLLIFLMILITYTGWKMIAIGKQESFTNVFTKVTIALGIVMVFLLKYWIALL
ncbi:hypothetical protein [Companilactobacillus nodensis]|uniref:Uncharacterized protein n=1 Tax=Companilactobacillus nodensis DSM 19682 = JCM 14932 = NBRC 107160 TaxID=1423775 RepID=A0A0R1K4P6_9LACO|nr:hypothetical protein [Companilactobacillus nodensis]KRK78550.1 hypothetical protein FD03_GL002325 [Companilactobacillus nodensis DSM 19682 = JCM 14932 = NBRC 107160]